VHLAEQSENGGSPLSDVAAFKKFQQNIAERCEEPPVSTQLSEVGSFHFFS
jgi:hypothetical protein